MRTETGRNKNETESLIGFYKFSVTVVEISSIKDERRRAYVIA